ncbi:hypothetical protein G3M83_17510 [Rouxiella badensis]|nr:hypothetical protein [Rouxiella badensis]QII40672.1 hypothetical protein G3M83_17510 [Rouxiella badensis]QOI57800.1 hypothetical protein H2866_12815 [Rouxiella badensis subsp. acadiensis]
MCSVHDARRAPTVRCAYMTEMMESWLFMPESNDLHNQVSQFIDTYIEMLRLCPRLIKGN